MSFSLLPAGFTSLAKDGFNRFATHSSDWLNVTPISFCNLRLNNEDIRSFSGWPLI